MARVQLDEGPQDVPQIALGLGLGMCTKGSAQLHIWTPGQMVVNWA